MKKPNKRKLIDWDKKNGSDSERISKRLEGRSELDDSVTTQNDTKPKTAPAATPKGEPLLKLRKKIREVYDEDDEDEDDTVTAPFFNISLIEDDELEHETARKEAQYTMKIVQQQQLAGKLKLAMNTATSIERAGLSGKMSPKEAQKIYSPSYNEQQLQKEIIKDKVVKPLGLKGNLPPDELEEALTGIKKVQKALPPDSLKNVPAKELSEFNAALDEEDMAKLILEKSGRKMPKKNLADIAKGINRYEQYEQKNQHSKNEQEKE